MQIFHTNTEKETQNLAHIIAAKLTGGVVVLLTGELGAGKSTLARGIGEYLGVKQTLTSPTFTLMNIYAIDKKNLKKLIHIDTYRLHDENQLLEIGAADYIGADHTISLIEWPEKLKKLLKNKKIINIKIEHTNNGRLIKIAD